MRNPPLSFTIAICLLLLPASVVGASAGPTPAVYHGGPVLNHYKIHVLFWGQWTKSDRDSWQSYARNLAAYISGDQAPYNMVPTIRQYGVERATLDKHQYTADTDQSCATPLTGCAMPRPRIAGPRGGPLLHTSIIWKAQNRSVDPLPGFGSHTLIVVFLPHHYYLSGCKPFPGCGGSYHSSESDSEFWAVIPEDQLQWVTGHEVQEASANPADDNDQGWDEVADPCDSTSGFTLPKLGGIRVPEIIDNTQGGACNATGYISKASLIPPLPRPTPCPPPPGGANCHT